MSGLSDADRAAIAALPGMWDKAAGAANWDAVTGTMSEDFAFVMPGMPPIEGKAAWREFAEQFPPGQQATVIDEIDGSGDLAYMWGHGNMKMADQSSLWRFLLILRRQSDGQWLVTREMVSFETPFELP